MNALVVDDNDDIRFLLRRILCDAGFDVAEARDGPGALAALRLAPLPTLVVLDVQMPDMDGWETLARIRSDPRTAELPVLLCTVKSSAADRVHGWELGCDGYLTKPFDPDLLVEAVRAVAGRSPDERARAIAAGLAEARRELLEPSEPPRALGS